MTRRSLLLVAVCLLAGCGSLSDKHSTILGQTNPTLLGQTLPGISDLDTITKEDKEDAKWWDGFYGRKTSDE